MVTEIKIKKLNGYINLANRAGYIIWGVDNLKNYSHKMYLILYREDYGKTIEKTLNRFDVDKIKLNIEMFNKIVGTENAKILAIKNKGITEQIVNLLRGEDG